MDTALYDRALMIGDWMLRNQVKNPFDANCGRGIDLYDARRDYLYMTANWTSGILCACFCALYRRTGERRWLDAAERAGRYIMSLQVLDPRKKAYFGLFRELTPQSVECAPRDSVSAAWGLVWLYNTTGNREYLERALLFAEWHLSYAMIDGWPKYALYMRDDLPDFYAQGSFQSGTGLFYHDLFVASGDARYVERGFRPIAVNYRDNFVMADGSLILEREAFTGRAVEMPPGVHMHAYNDDFGAAMLQTAADFFKDESFRDAARRYALWLVSQQDPDGAFAGGAAPSGVPTSLMYYHDLGVHYQDRTLLDARRRSLNKLLEMQHLDTGDPRLDGGIQGALDLLGNPPEIPHAPKKHVHIRCSSYALMALLKLESDLQNVWLGRFNRRWKDPLHAPEVKECLKKLGYLDWQENA